MAVRACNDSCESNRRAFFTVSSIQALIHTHHVGRSPLPPPGPDLQLCCSGPQPLAPSQALVHTRVIIASLHSTLHHNPCLRPGLGFRVTLTLTKF